MRRVWSPDPMDATRTSVSVERRALPSASALARIRASRIEKMRSIPTLIPMAGTSLPENMPTRPS